MTQQPATSNHSMRKTPAVLAGVAIAMLCLGLASKPLYDKFCSITGYGGTTQVSDQYSIEMIDRDITVRFDANVQNDLYWTFKPEDISMTVKLGQNALAFYTAKNNSDVPIVGTASYNVSPIKAAPFFSKIECFCFTEQRLEPGESVRMPVLFYVDPSLADEERLDEVKTITLSYTFHNVDNPGAEAYTAEQREVRLKELQTLNLSQ